jgi:hypothetical protein
VEKIRPEPRAVHGMIVSALIVNITHEPLFAR